MPQMLLPSIHEQVQEWRMKPAAVLTDLASTGAAVFRWRRLSTDMYRFQRTTPRDYTLLSVMLGPMQAWASVGNRQVWQGLINSGQVRLLQPSQCASWVSDSSFDILHVHLPTQALAAAAQAQGLTFEGFRGTRQPIYQNDPIIYLVARQLAHAIAENSRSARLHADMSVQILIAHLLKNYELSSPSLLQHHPRPGLVEAFRYIEDHPGEKLGIAQLANVAAMSEFHFARQFKRVFGTSPHAQVLSVRLQLARRALEQSSSTVLEIALECGFVDSSHFARVFRKAYGLSPASFRRSRLLS